MCSINHDLKAIYIHIPKNGGVYIEYILQKYYGFKLDYIIKPDNYGFADSIDNPVLPVDNRGVLKYYMNSGYINKEYNMTEQKWKEYYKFTFVRNPYTKIISAYEFLKDNYNGNGNGNGNSNYYNKNIDTKFPSFREFFENQNLGFNHKLYHNSKNMFYYHYYHSFITQTDHLLNNDDIIDINYIGNFENLNEELITVLKNLGISNYTKHLKEIKNNTKSNITNKLTIGHYFDQELLDVVNTYFNDDFIKFNYSKYSNLTELSCNINFVNIEKEFINKNKVLIFRIPENP